MTAYTKLEVLKPIYVSPKGLTHMLSTDPATTGGHVRSIERDGDTVVVDFGHETVEIPWAQCVKGARAPVAMVAKGDGGASIVEGVKQAIAFARGDDTAAAAKEAHPLAPKLSPTLLERYSQQTEEPKPAKRGPGRPPKAKEP